MKVVRAASLEELEQRFGRCASRDLVREWLLARLESEDEFLLLMNHFTRNPIGDLAASDWANEPINVKKVKEIQLEILRTSAYGALLPVVIRDLFPEEEVESPRSTFWLEDGIHRSLAIADLLVKDQLFCPRRGLLR